MNIYSQSEITIFFKKINKLKIFVVGDAMLDLYWYGNIERISPEAPVPIVHVTHKETRLGGAANVALNCVAMGAEVYLLSTIGKDEQGKQMKSLLEEKNILTNFLLQSVDRITTTKTRVIAKNQQTIRIDDEIVSHLNVKDEHHFIDTCLRAIQIEKPDIVIFEDYNKGLLSENMIEKIITHCKHVGVMTSVDPKLENFFAYKHVDLFKPNLKEVRDAFNIKLEKIDIKNLKKIHTLLFQKLQHHNTIITLSEKGIFVHNDKNASLIPTHIRTIADVSGAGDTVISVASILFFLTKNLTFAAQIANIAGGLVCEQVGVVAINKTKLLREVLQVNQTN